MNLLRTRDPIVLYVQDYLEGGAMPVAGSAHLFNRARKIREL